MKGVGMRYLPVTRMLQYAAFIILGGTILVAVLLMSRPHTPNQDAGVAEVASIVFHADGSEAQAQGDETYLKIIRQRYQAGQAQAGVDSPWHRILIPDRFKAVSGARYLLQQVIIEISGPTERNTKVTLIGFYFEEDLWKALNSASERERLGIYGRREDTAELIVP